MKKLKSFLLSSLFLLGSCGYRWEPNYPQATRPSISIPFIAGDEEGTLTTEITHSLASSGIADVVSKGGDYRLQINIVNSGIDITGFRIDPQKIRGEVKHNLLACEGRKTLKIEASLYRGEELAYGPYKIYAAADYDYVDGDSIQDLTFVNPAGETVIVLPFSLGQLESSEAAQEAATRPLYARVAQKIVDAISSEW